MAVLHVIIHQGDTVERDLSRIGEKWLTDVSQIRFETTVTKIDDKYLYYNRGDMQYRILRTNALLGLRLRSGPGPASATVIPTQPVVIREGVLIEQDVSGGNGQAWLSVHAPEPTTVSITDIDERYTYVTDGDNCYRVLNDVALPSADAYANPQEG